MIPCRPSPPPRALRDSATLRRRIQTHREKFGRAGRASTPLAALRGLGLPWQCLRLRSDFRLLSLSRPDLPSRTAQHKLTRCNSIILSKIRISNVFTPARPSGLAGSRTLFLLFLLFLQCRPVIGGDEDAGRDRPREGADFISAAWRHRYLGRHFRSAHRDASEKHSPLSPKTHVTQAR